MKKFGHHDHLNFFGLKVAPSDPFELSDPFEHLNIELLVKTNDVTGIYIYAVVGFGWKHQSQEVDISWILVLVCNNIFEQVSNSSSKVML